MPAVGGAGRSALPAPAPALRQPFASVPDAQIPPIPPVALKGL
jgi:hypothetical protein